MATGVVAYKLDKLSPKVNITKDDWVSMGMRTGFEVLGFIQNEKNRNQLRKNITDAITTLDTAIKQEKSSLNNQLIDVSKDAEYKFNQAFVDFENKKRKLLMMLAYIDKKRILINYETIATVIGIVVIAASIAYIGIKIAQKGAQK